MPDIKLSATRVVFTNEKTNLNLARVRFPNRVTAIKNTPAIARIALAYPAQLSPEGSWVDQRLILLKSDNYQIDKNGKSPTESICQQQDFCVLTTGTIRLF